MFKGGCASLWSVYIKLVFQFSFYHKMILIHRRNSQYPLKRADQYEPHARKTFIAILLMGIDTVV